MDKQKGKRARILLNEKNQCFEVHTQDAHITQRGQLHSCEQWCSMNGYDVVNRTEINRIKYSNIPTGN